MELQREAALPEGVHLVTAGIPGRRHLDPEGLGQLAAEVAAAAVEQPSLLVVTGVAPGLFGLGLDLVALRRPEGTGSAYLEPLQAAAAPVLEQLAHFPAPTVALLEGAAIGASLTVALACDGRAAVPGPSTVMGFAEVGLGLLPVLGGLPYLAWVVGPVRAAEMMASGRRVSAPEGLRLGVVDRLLSPEQPLESLIGWAGQQQPRLQRRRRRPRRYPQGRTWADLILEGTGPGRRWLRRRIGRRLETLGVPAHLRGELLAGVFAGTGAGVLAEGDRARRGAARIATTEGAADALSLFTMREWAHRQVASEEAAEQAARRLSGTWFRQGFQLLIEGASLDRIDAATRRAGMGPGPFFLMDRHGWMSAMELVREQMRQYPDPANDRDLHRLLDVLSENQVGSRPGFYRVRRGRRLADSTIYEALERAFPDFETGKTWGDRGYEASASRLEEAVIAVAAQGVDPEHPAWIWDLAAITALEWSPADGGPLRRRDRAGRSSYFPTWPLPPDPID
jgi:enoyl-CoA hydratase/carnithine racemase